MIQKVRPHLSPNESLLFERSSPAKNAYQLPDLDVPAAGPHGGRTVCLLIRALLQSRGNPRKKILFPDSAHGTHPATAAIAGYAVENIKSSETGVLDVGALEQLVTDDVAALMVTNPN